MDRRHASSHIYKDPEQVALEILTRPKKHFWTDRKLQVWTFYCPLCRTERRLPHPPRPGAPKYVIRIALTAAFFTCLTWHWFAWKGIVSFFPIWGIFEFFFRTRLRAKLNCPHCGFDPFLYLVDVDRARDEVEKYWRNKFAEKGIPYPEKKQPASAGKTAQVESPNSSTEERMSS